MLKKRVLWALMISFLFPIYSYADRTSVPDFQTVEECQTWVRLYAKKVKPETFYDFDFYSWLNSFAVSRSYSKESCVNGNCTEWFYGDERGPATGGCDMIGYEGDQFFKDAWVIAKRNLVDMISLYESKLTLLPEYRYGKECHYPEGSHPREGECGIMMHYSDQPCATLNALNNRLHIPCLNDGGALYWKEADLLEPWTFEISNSGPGFDVPGHRDDCATYTASAGIIHIPCLKMGENSYWADFEVIETDPMQLRLKDYGKN